MRARACEPGSVIVAGRSLPDAPDLYLGRAVRIRKWFGRTIVVDEEGREWCGGVWVLPPGSYRLCTGEQGLVRYPAVRLLGGLSRPLEPRRVGLVAQIGTPGRVAGRSSATTRKDALGVNRTRPFQSESGAFSS